MSTALSDTQLVILTNAAANNGDRVFPLPKSVKVFGATVYATMRRLKEVGMVEFTKVPPTDHGFRADNGDWVNPTITKQALALLRIDDEASPDAPNQKEENAMAKKANPETTDQVTDAPATRTGGPRNPNRKLFPADKLEGKNPRREGSHGFNSMQLILDSPGITYGEYIAAGGRSNDLAWDIKHENVRVEQTV